MREGNRDSFRPLLDSLLAALLMSLGWSLRGQFGHLKGALIPGALAALAVALIRRGPLARREFAPTVLWGALGFSLGGHLAYGRLIDGVLASPGLLACGLDLLRCFLIGAVWGGLGLTILAWGLSEKGRSRMDFFLLSALGLILIVVLGILKWEAWDLCLFAACWAALQLYNIAFKKSHTVAVFGAAGFWGFGAAFLGSVLLLYAGHHGLFGRGFPWWALRDQILGFFGGLAVAWAASRGAPSSSSTVSLERGGLLFYAVFIPAVNAANVFLHWIVKQPLPSFSLWLAMFFPVAALLVSLALFLLFYDPAMFSGPLLDRAIFWLSCFFMTFLSVLASAKETLPAGWSRWEPGFTLFFVFTLLVTPIMASRLLRN